MASAQPIQIEANEPLSLPEGLEYRMAKSVEPATFFLYDEKSKQNIPITPKMQQDIQKGIRIPTVKEEISLAVFVFVSACSLSSRTSCFAL